MALRAQEHQGLTQGGHCRGSVSFPNTSPLFLQDTLNPGIHNGLISLFFTYHPPLIPKSFLKIQSISHTILLCSLTRKRNLSARSQMTRQSALQGGLRSSLTEIQKLYFLISEMWKRVTAPIQQPPASHFDIKFHLLYDTSKCSVYVLAAETCRTEAAGSKLEIFLGLPELLEAQCQITPLPTHFCRSHQIVQCLLR